MLIYTAFCNGAVPLSAILELYAFRVTVLVHVNSL